MTDTKTEICNDEQTKDVFNNRTLSFLQDLQNECYSLGLDKNEGEILTGVISVVVAYLIRLTGTEVTNSFLQQVMAMYEASENTLN